MATGTLFGGGDTSALTNATADSRQRAADFYRQLAQLQQQYQQQLAAQSALGRAYDKTIAGTAPSVAGTQLQQGLGQTRNAISAQASGASGQNAAMANYGAIQALGAAQAKQQQDAAILRAKEVAEAEQAKAQLLNQQQAATGNMAGQATAAGTALSGQGVSGGGKIGELNQQEIGAERNFYSNLAGGASSALVASDEDLKTDKKPVSGGQMDEFLKHISGFTFKYKDEATPNGGPGKRVGEMAQDVHKGGDIGKMVSNGHEIDMRNALGAALAAIAHVNRKVDARTAA